MRRPRSSSACRAPRRRRADLARPTARGDRPPPGGPGRSVSRETSPRAYADPEADRDGVESMPRVLIVEDSPTQAQRFALHPGRRRVRFETAPDAEPGLAPPAPERFDLVLSDLHLPGRQRLRPLPARSRPTPGSAASRSSSAPGEADPLERPPRAPEWGRQLLHQGPRPERDRQRASMRGPRPAGRRDCGHSTVPPIRVAFLDETFGLRAGREQLLEILALRLRGRRPPQPSSTAPWLCAAPRAEPAAPAPGRVGAAGPRGT